MTDKFVPTEPGWYWHFGGPFEVFRNERGKLRVWSTWLGYGAYETHAPISSFSKWIAPVTPPDVAREVREALAEAVACLDAMRDDSNGPSSNPYFAPMPAVGREIAAKHDRARAVIAKLPKIGGAP